MVRRAVAEALSDPTYEYTHGDPSEHLLGIACFSIWRVRGRLKVNESVGDGCGDCFDWCVMFLCIDLIAVRGW